MADDGYVRVYRKMLDSAVMDDDWLCRLWMWCLLKANWKDGVFHGHPVKSGSFVFGRNTSAAQLHVSPSKLYRGLHRLEELGQVTIQANSRWTTVSLCNWTTYQNESSDKRTADEQQVNSGRTADEQQMNTIEERKQERRKEGKKENKTCGETAEPPSPPLMTFPTVRGRHSEATEWPLYEATVIDLQQAFPAVDVMAECRKALAWSRTHEKQRKTFDGMGKFLFAWMAKNQDRNDRINANGSRSLFEKPKAVDGI